MKYNFEWDPKKALINTRKHGVTFEQASKIFKDPIALTIYDDNSSETEEDRWITLGQVDNKHYLVVVHTYRGQSKEEITIRLISARPATKYEIKQYQG